MADPIDTDTLRMQADGAEAAGDPVMLPPDEVRIIVTAHHDHSDAVRRPSAPRVVPPVRRDVATIRREVEKRKALARIRGVR